MKNVVVRALSGAVYVALIVGAVLAGWPYMIALTVLFGILASIEFNKLFNNYAFIAASFLDALAMAALIAIPAGYGNESYGMDILRNCCMIYLPTYLVLRVVAAIYDRREHPFMSTAMSFASLVYIGLPLMCLNIMYMLGGETSKWLVLIMFIMIWLNDTGAYCVGSAIGKHRLCERLSPKKSWEGFWGGMVFCMLFGLGCFLWGNVAGMSVIYWLAMGALVSAFGTWGDLFESMLKRSQHVKDSGSLIPGHGGILDRIDSLLLVAPTMLVFLLQELLS